MMLLQLLQSASHEHSRMRLYYCAHNPATGPHRAVWTAEEAACELRPSPLAEGPLSRLLAAPRKARRSQFEHAQRPKRRNGKEKKGEPGLYHSTH